MLAIFKLYCRLLLILIKQLWNNFSGYRWGDIFQTPEKNILRANEYMLLFWHGVQLDVWNIFFIHPPLHKADKYIVINNETSFIGEMLGICKIKSEQNVIMNVCFKWFIICIHSDMFLHNVVHLC